MFRFCLGRFHACMFLAGALIVVALFLSLARIHAQESVEPVGLVQDWSTQHAIFPRIGPVEVMLAAQSDPRAHQAWQRALLGIDRGPGAVSVGKENIPEDTNPPSSTSSVMHPDWSINLGAQGMAKSMYPAKFSFNVNANPSCANDFAVFPVNQSPTSTQENLVAFNNLYSGTVPANGICNRTPSAHDVGTSATVMWSYAIQSTDNAGVMTSPALSLNGTKLAFVTSKSGQQPRFHVLAWKSGDGVNANNLQDPGGATKLITTFTIFAPTTGSGTITDLAFGASSGSPGDTLSSPYIDYSHDTAYIGDDKGNLVRIKDIFCTVNPLCQGGSPPAPSIDTTWGNLGTVVVGSGSCSGTATSKLTGPVRDFRTGNVFVGCADGKLYGFNSSGTALAGSPVLVGNNSATGGLQDAPLVDGVNGRVYAFSGSNGANSIAVQIHTDLSSRRQVTLGKGNVSALHAGTFNDGYYSSNVSTNWFLYALGYNGGGTQTFLYWIGFDASRNMNTSTSGSLNTHPGTSECSPITEFLNGADRLFFSPLAGNKVSAYTITGNPPSAPASATEQGGSTGIIVDNVSTKSQASSIYFSTLGNQACAVGGTGHCAVKLTQSTLQ